MNFSGPRSPRGGCIVTKLPASRTRWTRWTRWTSWTRWGFYLWSAALVSTQLGDWISWTWKLPLYVHFHFSRLEYPLRLFSPLHGIPNPCVGLGNRETRGGERYFWWGCTELDRLYGTHLNMTSLKYQACLGFAQTLFFWFSVLCLFLSRAVQKLWDSLQLFVAPGQGSDFWDHETKVCQSRKISHTVENSWSHSGLSAGNTVPQL